MKQKEKVIIPFECAVSLNIGVILHYTHNLSLKWLWAYAKAVQLTAGVGHMPKEQFIKALVSSCKISKASAYRWIDFYLKEKIFVEHKNGQLHINAKHKYAERLEVTQKWHFKFNDYQLASYKEFSRAVVILLGLHMQNGFKKKHKVLIKNTGCPLLSTGISYPISSYVERTGCAQNYLVKKTGLSKGTINAKLRGVLKHNWKTMCTISYQDYLLRVKMGYWKDHPRLRCHVYKSEGYVKVRYQLPSTILSGLSIGDSKEYIVLRQYGSKRNKKRKERD